MLSFSESNNANGKLDREEFAELIHEVAGDLKLLEERDAELERYDASFANLKAVIRERDVEMSELKIAASELQHAATQERDRAPEPEKHEPSSKLPPTIVMKFVKINAPTWRPIYEDDSSPAMQSYSWEELESLAANYYFYKGTAEVHKFSHSKDYDTCSVLKNGIIYYTGRILEGQAIEDPTSTFHDVERLHFVRPILDRFSPVAYSVMLSCHSDTLKHRSSPATLRESRSVAYILKGRDLSNEITDNCRPCHRFRARLVEAEMSKLHQSRLTIAPAFYFVQCDLFGPLKMVCEHHSRSTLKGYGVVFKDPASSCVAAFAMQSYSTPSFLQAFTRFAVRYGVPTKVVIDQGSQLVSAFESMDLCVRDIEQSLQVNYNVKIEYSTAPVGGHNFNGMAERSIQEIKGLLSKTFGGLRTDLLTLETNLAWVCNEINSLPICLGSKTEGLGSLDILTPNRLLLGRNNRRALGGYAKIDQPGRMLDQQDQMLLLSGF